MGCRGRGPFPLGKGGLDPSRLIQNLKISSFLCFNLQYSEFDTNFVNLCIINPLEVDNTDGFLYITSFPS